MAGSSARKLISDLRGTTEQNKNRFLDAYIRTYLREDIQLEQIIRNITRFRRFLAFAGQMREDFSGQLTPSTSIFGEIFEQWFVLECHRLRDYFETRDEFFYLRTKLDFSRSFAETLKLPP